MTGRLSRATPALALALLAGCAGPAPQPARAGSGAPAATIVSLNPCSDAVLARWLGPERLRAISHYSHDPAATSMPLPHARRYPATGGTVEEVAALRPDLVIGSTFMAPATRAAFARLGFRVEALPIANDVPAALAQVERLGQVAGMPTQAQALAQAMRQAVAAAAPPPGTRPVTAVVWQEGGIVPGGMTLIDDQLRRAGFVSHSAREGLGQGSYLSLEQVLRDPPEVLFVAGADRALRHPALRSLPGTRVVKLPGRLLYCGGPTVIEAARFLAQVRRDVRGAGR